MMSNSLIHVKVNEVARLAKARISQLKEELELEIIKLATEKYNYLSNRASSKKWYQFWIETQVPDLEKIIAEFREIGAFDSFDLMCPYSKNVSYAKYWYYKNMTGKLVSLSKLNELDTSLMLLSVDDANLIGYLT